MDNRRSEGSNSRIQEDFNDPDAQNSEQNEDGTQAQDVAEDAFGRSGDPSEDSEPGGKGNPADLVPRDLPDLVDKMKDMKRSGKIDMDAHAGEEKMDDKTRPR